MTGEKFSYDSGEMSTTLPIPLATVGPTGELLFSQTAADVRVAIPEGWVAATTEGDAVRVEVRLTVRAPNGEDDRRAFRQMLMQGRSVVMPSDVATACLGRLEGAVRGLSAGGGEAWLGGDESLVGPIRRAVAATAYVCGLEVMGEIAVVAEVPAYTLRRAEQRRREALSEAESRRMQSARQAAGLLQELRETQQTAADLLSRMTPEEGQAVLLAALGNEGADGGQGAALWCVAGGSLVGVRLGARAGEVADPVVLPLPGKMGPARSVFATGGELLIGARDGVWRVDRPAGNAMALAGVMELTDGPMAVEHGFSVVARGGDVIYAAHRQRGLVWWEPGSGWLPRGAIRPEPVGVPGMAPAARKGPPPLPGVGAVSVQATNAGVGAEMPRAGVFSALWALQDGGGVVAASDRLERIRPDGSREHLGLLTCRCLLLAEADGLLAGVGEDGVVRLYDPVTIRAVGEVGVGEAVTSAGTFGWAGGTRLLCATQSGGMVAVGVADPVVLRYASAHRGLREVAGGGGMVAAVSPDRMRLVIWHAWEPRRPAAEVHVGALVRGRIADVCVA